MGATEAIADWATGATFADLPSNAVDVVRRSLLDWIGCAVLGSAHPASRIVQDFARTEAAAPVARVIATDWATSSHTAGWVNAVMGHVHDFDDSGAHPSSYLSPTVLALGDELAADGRSVLVAWATGFEVSARLAADVHPDRAWHTTPLYGTLGATAAAGRLLHLTTDQLRRAFGIAASSTGGLMANFGSMTKALHPANAVRNGIIAATLAKRGFTANPDILESPYGYVDCFGGDEASFPAMTARLGQVTHADVTPPAIKAWPTCSSNHATLTVIAALLERTPLDSGQIQSVDHYSSVVTGTGSLRFREVGDPLQAKFCLEYNIAAAFVDGVVNLATFTDERFRRGDLQRFMRRVHRHHDPGTPARASAPQQARLVVAMADGTRFDLPIAGRRTLTTAETTAKFRTNIQATEAGLDPAAIQAQLDVLEDQPSVRGLMDLLSRGRNDPLRNADHRPRRAVR